MITGTIFLILGFVALVLVVPTMAWDLKSDSDRAFLLMLLCLVIMWTGLTVGLSTYECAPNSPLFQFFGPCQGGVPWP